MKRRTSQFNPRNRVKERKIDKDTDAEFLDQSRELAESEFDRAAMFQYVPTHMHEGFERWILEGKMGGSFMNALLSNDLIGTFAMADSINIKCIDAYTRWLYNDTPAGCFGSPENVEMWAESGGLIGWHTRQLENHDD